MIVFIYKVIVEDNRFGFKFYINLIKKFVFK